MSEKNKEDLVDLEGDTPATGTGFDVSILYDPRSSHTPEQKMQAVMAFVVTGTSKQAAKLTGINDATIRDWKTRSSWWPDAVEECRKRKQEQLDGEITGVIHKALTQVEDRIENGETKVSRDGTVTKTPMNGKDLAMVAAIMFDKRQLLRGDVTSRSESRGGADVDKLQQQFEEMSKKMNAKVISEQ